MKLVIHKNSKVYKFDDSHYKLLCSSISKNNYPKISFYKDGNCRFKTLLIHRLLAKGYIPNPENKPCVNHINGIKIDNRIENLEWVTHRENTNHSFSTGLQKTGNRGGGIYPHKTRQGKPGWSGEILHNGKKYKKRNMRREIVEDWLEKKLKELQS